MKKVILALLCTSLASVGGVANAEEKTFALVPKAMNNPFFDLARDGCQKADKELDDVKCYYIGPGEHTELEQVQIVQDLISQGVDGIAVSPSNAPAMGKALQRAVKAGIPVMTWDADLLDEDKGIRKLFVGTNNRDIGVNLAKIALKLKPNGGSVCLQTGGAAAANHNERLAGIRDTLAGRGKTTPPGDVLNNTNGWTEVAGCPLITDDDGTRAVQGLTDILNKESDLDVFISTGAFTQWNDNAYRQAVAPHKARLSSGDLVILVADTLPMQMEQLADGLAHGNVGQRPFEMGYKAMYFLKDIVEGKSVSDPSYTGLDVCTQDNHKTCIQE